MIVTMRTAGLILWIAVATAALGATGGGCAPAKSEGDFHSADPGVKLYAITRAGRERDRSAIPHLIEQLDSDDHAVRMYSIVALERITGTRLGYVHHAPEHRRREAIERWVEAYRAGEFDDPPARVEEVDEAPAEPDAES